ncbi:MAG: hypothetical protein DRP45_01975 [Candidatus Zixiibacteriota bacterium]|nr:MAG: hypothetical protein DRP45_01975 [candidate division Zixibacteria bacterium]
MNWRLYAVITAILASMLTPATAQEVFEEDHGWYTTGEIGLKKTIGDVRKVVIKSVENLSGQLTIEVGPVNEIQITYSKRAKADSHPLATDYIDLISMSLNILSKEARVELRAPNPAPWEKHGGVGAIEARLIVPESCHVKIEANLFDVTAHGPLKAVVIPSSLGRLNITAVTDLLDISTVNRRITLDSISGDISATTTNSSLMARSISATNKQAMFRNYGGNILIEGFSGAINVKNTFGRIEVLDFTHHGKNSLIRGSSAPVTLEITEMTEGNLVISNRHEDIEITIPDTLSAFFSLAVGDDGVIEATNFPFTTDLIWHNRLNLVSGNGEIDISGSVRGTGNIFVRGREGD